MAKQYVLTLTAANRVGILAAVTHAVAELGGDLVEVKQSVLQDYFNLILAADFPDHRSPEVISDHIRCIGRPYGMEVCLKDPDLEAGFNCEHPFSEYQVVTLTARDAPGTMRQITVRLAQEGVDIVDLHAVRNEDGRSFSAKLTLSVPEDVDVNELKSQLEADGRSVDLIATLYGEAPLSASVDPPLLT